MRVVLSDAMYALGHVAEQGGEKVRLACDTDSAKLLQSVGLQNFTAGNVDRSILIFDVKGVGCTRMKPTTHATIGEETGRNVTVQCDPEHLEQEAPRSMYEEPNGFPWTMVIREHVLKVVHVPNASSSKDRRAS
ncbi:MAG: uncharacterized protein KVP18_004893 [Porospora cf. gigantea A]|uniref:uncharacterized protein n=1 Tax=Porospora cf. gigantea A TaxID=2853593 RepID=UPI00355A90E6|nr:MAG: hypothetical protein KVP18_004893 [Porospora cf. gigantea A]